MDQTINQLYYIQHSCYLWEGNTAFLLFDYYGEGNPLRYISTSPQKTLYLLNTHSHPDHYSPTILEEFKHLKGEVKYIFHSELQDKVNPLQATHIHFLATGDSYRDSHLLVKAYGSTDIGGSFYCEIEGLKIFHAGDLNNWHWNEEADQYHVQLYEEAWHQELAHLTKEISSLDLLMFPTDLRLGRDYLRGAEELLSKIKVHYFAPMHINGQLNPTELYRLAERKGCTVIIPNNIMSHR